MRSQDYREGEFFCLVATLFVCARRESRVVPAAPLLYIQQEKLGRVFL